MEPTNYIPQGKLGAHRLGSKLFQVQTEFAHRPHPRVTSSVILDGRIVHKTDKEWSGGMESEAERAALDALIADQHKATLEMVQARAVEFLGVESPIAASPGYPTPTIRDTIEEVLRSVPYTIGFYEFDNEGEVVHRSAFRDMVADWDREFAAVSSLVYGLPEIIKVGEFRYGLISFGAENLIAARIRGRSFGILTDPSATCEHLRKDFPEFFEAIYNAADPA
ncbi:MAG: hypothetical protein AB1752_05130 [Candidatus Zixiibacteriota bacterium]